MANLEPMPISSLPEGSIQDGDKMIIYRDSNGKAYQSDASSMESVAELKEEVDKLSADLTDFSADLANKAASKYYTGTLSAMVADWTETIANGYTMIFSCYGETAQALTNSSTTLRWYGIVCRSGTSYDFRLFANQATTYYGRVTDGALARLFSITGSSVSI